MTSKIVVAKMGGTIEINTVYDKESVAPVARSFTAPATPRQRNSGPLWLKTVDQSSNAGAITVAVTCR